MMERAKKSIHEDLMKDDIERIEFLLNKRCMEILETTEDIRTLIYLLRSHLSRKKFFHYVRNLLRTFML